MQKETCEWKELSVGGAIVRELQLQSPQHHTRAGQGRAGRPQPRMFVTPWNLHDKGDATWHRQLIRDDGATMERKGSLRISTPAALEGEGERGVEGGEEGVNHLLSKTAARR